MNAEEYGIMYRVEDRHWWYRGLRAVVDHCWQRYVEAESPEVLDIGCGTGAILSALSGRSRAAGIDLSPEAIRFCRERGQRTTGVASALALPFAADSFDAAVMLDVLYHRSVPDKRVPLEEAWRVLRPGGVFLINLPAYQWLYSSHDVAVHTDRRFTRGEACRLLRGAGFEILTATYWNTILFPPIAAVRLLKKLAGSRKSDLDGEFEGLSNEVFAGVLGVERRLMALHPFPFGLSVFVAARKG